MDCIQGRRLVTPYLEEQLDAASTRAFLKHIEHCPDCMDELDTYFTIYQALESLDTGKTQEKDMHTLLLRNIEENKKYLWMNRVRRIFHGFFLVLAELMLIVCLVQGLQVKWGQTELSAYQRALLRIAQMTNRDQSPDEELQEETETMLPELAELTGQQILQKSDLEWLLKERIEKLTGVTP